MELCWAPDEAEGEERGYEGGCNAEQREEHRQRRHCALRYRQIRPSHGNQGRTLDTCMPKRAVSTFKSQYRAALQAV